MLRITKGARLARALALGLILVLGAGMSAAEAGGFSGRAFGAFVNAPTLGVEAAYVADTGTLPEEGGWEGAGLSDAEVGTILAAQTLVAATAGPTVTSGGDQASTSTSLAGLVLFPGSPAELTASFVRAQAAAGSTGVSATTEIDGLTFAGMPIAVTGVPNQQVTIPGVATLTINEQAITAGEASREVTVNALRLTLATGEEVIVSSATSSASY